MARDIFILLRKPKLHKQCCDTIVQYIRKNYGITADNVERTPTVEAIVAPDTKGFLFAASVAKKLGLSFIPIRKGHKLLADEGDLITATFKSRTNEVSLYSMKFIHLLL